jgi:hypothetical protein
VALDDRYANKFSPLDSTTIYPKPGYALLYTAFGRWNEMPYRLYICLAHSIQFHLLQCWCNTCTNLDQQMIWSISYHHVILLVILTSLAFHRCFGPSAPSLCSSFLFTRFMTSKPPTCPSHLQSVHQAKPHLDLLHLVTWLYVMSHQWAPSLHVWALQISKPFSPPWHVLLTQVYFVD